MLVTLPYTDNASRDAVIASMGGAKLVEDKITLEGNFLVFRTYLYSQHIGKVLSIDVTKAKPVKVLRKWSGYEYQIDCLVGQNIVTIYQAGKLVVNDYVIVSFIDEMPDSSEFNLAIVVDKVFKSWT